jgi:hypothetical protein
MGRSAFVRPRQQVDLPESGWDHDHCAFCDAEIAATKTTAFHWAVVSTTAKP